MRGEVLGVERRRRWNEDDKLAIISSVGIEGGYGNIVSIYTGADKTVTALTDKGIEEMNDMIRDARISTKTWHEFLEDFVDDAELIARIKTKSPR